MKKDETAPVVPVRPGDAEKTSYGTSGSTNKSSGELPTPSDGGWGWAVVFAAFMINFVGKGNISALLISSSKKVFIKVHVSFVI